MLKCPGIEYANNEGCSHTSNFVLLQGSLHPIHYRHDCFLITTTSQGREEDTIIDMSHFCILHVLLAVYLAKFQKSSSALCLRLLPCPSATR